MITLRDSRPPQVLHLTTVDISLRYLLLNQLAFLKAAGFEVLGASAPGEHVKTVLSCGIAFYPIPMTRRITPLADLRCLVAAIRLLRHLRPQILHVHTAKAELIGLTAARLAGVPIVVDTLRDIYFLRDKHPVLSRFFFAATRFTGRFSDVVLVQSREVAKAAVDEGLFPADKVKILGNGIDLERFDPSNVNDQESKELRFSLGILEDAPVIGFVGRLVSEKGIFELLEAARDVVALHPGTKFLVVGPVDTEKADAVTPEAAAEQGLKDAFVFTGLRNDMPEMLSLMDVFVLPSYREGFPRSPMEASAMGLPCVVTDIRGCREVVSHGENGLLVPVRDSIALKDAILFLLEHKDERRRMGENGRRIAQDRFDERKVFQIVKGEYERLLRLKGLPLPQSGSSTTHVG